MGKKKKRRAGLSFIAGGVPSDCAGKRETFAKSPKKELAGRGLKRGRGGRGAMTNTSGWQPSEDRLLPEKREGTRMVSRNSLEREKQKLKKPAGGGKIVQWDGKSKKLPWRKPGRKLRPLRKGKLHARGRRL